MASVPTTVGNPKRTPNPTQPEKTMKITLLGFVAFLLFVGATASAQTWVGGTGTWDDTTTANWSTGAVPVNGNTVNLTQAAATDINIGYSATGLSGTGLAQLYLYHTGTAKTTFTLDGTGANADALPVSTYVSIGQWADGEVEFNLRDEAILSINGSNAFRLGAAGRTGTFTVNQSGGTFNNGVGGASLFYVGQGGTYNLSGMGVVNANRSLTIESGGIWNQTGGAATFWSGLSVAAGGAFYLSDGSFLFSQAGQSISLAQNAIGSWSGGTLAGNNIGRFQLNGSGASWTMQGGTITVNNGGGSSASQDSFVVVASATVQGYGTIQDARFGASSPATFDNSGRVIANGYGVERDFNLSRFGQTPATSMIVNSSDNPTTNGSNGWFAVNQGRLLLPGMTVTSATTSYNWGEAAADTTIDLVNSARLTFAGLGGGSGTLTGALLAVDRSDVPAFAVAGMSRAELFSVHDLNLAGIAFSDFDLTIRYDDVAAAGFEGVLQIFHYTGGAWMPLASTVDLSNKWITASDIDAFSLFAVGYAIPEPTSALLLGLAGLLARRRRR